MGHHYLPRRLLQGFAVDGFTWAFDKKLGSAPKHLPIARVAQEPGMYLEELESRLNNEIEQPFNAVLECIAAGGVIEPSHIEAIARYVLTMYRRVPKGRTRSTAAAHDVMATVQKRTLADIDRLEQLDPGASALADQGRANVSEIFTRLRSQDTEWLWQETLLPERLPNAVRVLSGMTWECWHAPGGKQLIIGDSPILFDESSGIGQPRAELIFPIRSDAALVATWRIGPRWQHRKLTAQQSKAINLRTAQSADRWVFAQRNEQWVMALCGAKG